MPQPVGSSRGATAPREPVRFADLERAAGHAKQHGVQLLDYIEPIP
jgi:hypothetical protein